MNEDKIKRKKKNGKYFKLYIRCDGLLNGLLRLKLKGRFLNIILINIINI